MSLFDFLFPQQAQAMHLRDIASTSSKASYAMRAKEIDEHGNRRRLGVLARRVEKLENDLALTAMVNALLVKRYLADTGKNLEQLRAEIAEVDRSDGVEDGGFDSDEMRRLLGLPVAEVAAEDGPGLCRDCGRKVLTGHKRCLYCGGTM